MSTPPTNQPPLKTPNTPTKGILADTVFNIYGYISWVFCGLSLVAYVITMVTLPWNITAKMSINIGRPDQTNLLFGGLLSPILLYLMGRKPKNIPEEETGLLMTPGKWFAACLFTAFVLAVFLGELYVLSAFWQQAGYW